VKDRLVRSALTILLVVILVSPLAGQESSDTALAFEVDDNAPAPEDVESLSAGQFGPGDNFSVVGAPDFRPLTSDTAWAYDGAGYLYRSGGANTTFWAPVHLPPGAVVDQVCVYGYKGAAAATNLTYDFAVYEMGSAGQAPGFLVLLPTVSSAIWGSPGGYHFQCHAVPSPHTVRVVADVNGDASTHPLVYRFVFNLVEADSDHRLGAARLRWHRAVGYNSGSNYDDIPVGHPLQPYVNALRDAGITTGCAASPARFCPDLPVTRGQMAIFLARALGLHWPY
jgi:hypothetical protein